MQIERGIVLYVQLSLEQISLLLLGIAMSLVFNVSTAKCIYVYHLKETVSKVSYPCRLHFMKLTAHIFLNLYFIMKHAQYLIVYAQFSVTLFCTSWLFMLYIL